MKKTFMTLFLLSICSLVIAAAQAPDQPPPDQQTSPSSLNIGKNITVTGCLQPGTEPNSYVLHNATPSDMSRSYQREGSDQSQASGDYSSQSIQDESQVANMPLELARAETSYTLIPEGQIDFKSHVGHKVEVTGKMMEASARTDQSSWSDTPSGQSSSSHNSSEMTGQPRFRVSSIRQLSQSCQ